MEQHLGLPASHFPFDDEKDLYHPQVEKVATSGPR